MGLKVLNCDDGEQVLYNSVTMVAFGIVHENSNLDLYDFLEWLGEREYSESLYYEWLKSNE